MEGLRNSDGGESKKWLMMRKVGNFRKKEMA